MTRKNSEATSLEIQLLNAEQIAARRVPLEEAELKNHALGNWHCSYCDQRFVSEMRFMKHQCEPKRRAEELKSPTGHAAYNFYRDWMKLKKFTPPGAAAFVESKFYRSFINFTKMVKDANISRPERYVELMVAGEISPPLWCSSAAYNVYTGWYDSLMDPLEQVQDSINYLMDICDKENVQLEGIFDHLGVQKLLALIRQRRLSPWFLFCSSKFGGVLKKVDKSELKAFDAVVNSSYWGGKFSSSKKTVEQIKYIVKELGL